METVTKLKDLTVDEFRTLISNSVRESMEDLLEDLNALSSKEYLTSIREAREDYKHGRIVGIEILNVKKNQDRRVDSS